LDSSQGKQRRSTAEERRFVTRFQEMLELHIGLSVVLDELCVNVCISACNESPCAPITKVVTTLTKQIVEFHTDLTVWTDDSLSPLTLHRRASPRRIVYDTTATLSCSRTGHAAFPPSVGSLSSQGRRLNAWKPKAII
jgi:hypothetical protein